MCTLLCRNNASSCKGRDQSAISLPNVPRTQLGTTVNLKVKLEQSQHTRNKRKKKSRADRRKKEEQEILKSQRNVNIYLEKPF